MILDLPQRPVTKQSSSVVQRHLAAALANATTITVEGGDHLLPLRDPATLAAVAADYLSNHRIVANA